MKSKPVKKKRKKQAKNRLNPLAGIFLFALMFVVAYYSVGNGKSSVTIPPAVAETPPVARETTVVPDTYLRQITPAGDPEQLIRHTGYTVSYNRQTHLANWVAWRLTPERIRGNVKRTDKFLPDPALPIGQAVTSEDYKNSGWDRGHLCPAGDNKWNRQAMKESFYLTNVCPQHHNLNRGDWNELEQKCRVWVQKEKCLYIVAGPLFYRSTPRTIGVHRVAVPDAFFKVILAPQGKKPKAIGFIYKNNAGNHPLDNYVNSVDQVERITGIDFFPALPDETERAVEAQCDLREWR